MPRASRSRHLDAGAAGLRQRRGLRQGTQRSSPSQLSSHDEDMVFQHSLI